MSSKIAEAQSHIDGLTVAQIILDFSTKYRNVYPKSVHISFAAVGPLQTLIGEAIQNGHLAVVGKGASGTRSVAEFHDYASQYAEAVEMGWIEPCPWNPFPSKSPWGRAIDDAYRRSVIQRQRRSDP